MQSGRTRRSWGFCGVLAAALGLSAGCAADGPRLEQALMADRGPNFDERYVIHCPDLLELDAPGCTGARPVGADGRIPLPDGSRLRVDGLTTAEVGRSGRRGSVWPWIRSTFALWDTTASKSIFSARWPGANAASLTRGRRRWWTCSGAGGVSPGASVGDVQVVRSHVADGSSPELFHVDLNAILLHGDPRSNIRLEPFDEVYVGELRRSSLKGAVPPWLRPLYERVCGIRPDATQARGAAER